MTSRREQHLNKLLRKFKKEFSAKYRRGSREHKEHLDDLASITLLKYAIEENLDQFAYLSTLLDLLEK